DGPSGRTRRGRSIGRRDPPRRGIGARGHRRRPGGDGVRHIRDKCPETGRHRRMSTAGVAPQAGVHSRWPGLIAAYRDRLEGAADWEPVTLFEGGTPLVPAPYLSELTGCEVYLKVEGANPTGSFKDRGMTMAMTDAKYRGQKAVLCASTGNTSASAAAYA